MNSSPTNDSMPVATKSRPLKVVLICHSDMLGGASIVTYRLMQALRYEGVDARMVVYTKISNDSNVDVISSRGMRGFKFLVERLRILVSNGFSRENLFKVSIANTGTAIHKHPWVAEADVINLSWINQGLLSINGIRRLGSLGKPIVWTMHDMWNLTGICHHSYDCKGYKESCGNCQFLTGLSGSDLSNKIHQRKKELYAGLNIHFVAVSNWLAGLCRQSSLLGDKPLSVIPNAFPINSFVTKPTHSITSFNIDYTRNIIVMGAARLDDPIKGLGYAIEALNYIFDNHPEIARTSTAVFFGDIRNPRKFDELRFPHIHIGRINDQKVIHMIYAASKVVLSTSLYETLPTTLIEGQASGCLAVTFGKGGQTDIVEHMKNGYIAEYRDAKSVARGILWAFEQNVDRDALHESVRRRYASSEIAMEYISLYNDLLSKQNASTQQHSTSKKH